MICTVHKNALNLQSQNRKLVAWMSGLVTGLQNRAQRFESASDLQIKHLLKKRCFFYYQCFFFLIMFILSN